MVAQLTSHISRKRLVQSPSIQLDWTWSRRN
ncbi:hypothetical protein MPTK1_4g16220 [Marchantia polymorpha subsp. ruderalis]|uniref:Uncharacterized protein n=2 Tax=Marchantia polymorpha TaxID=3197 RepID=A0AAF6BAF9_MARPO|nr:hypothetical protein MARPO_0054s0087 [Marchantia polymorpha]BBN08993.1 hypothetical protein Mp_4g16220 [Marchantia polymorpha subsp. ruderalis]|eukprot:PTQ37980.1 hypothetical protein MARPO_0054s0087 [Marchantia polymorpha]